MKKSRERNVARSCCGESQRAGFEAVGAGEGNRTLVISLGSYSSTIELHPREDEV